MFQVDSSVSGQLCCEKCTANSYALFPDEDKGFLFCIMCGNRQDIHTTEKDSVSKHLHLRKKGVRKVCPTCKLVFYVRPSMDYRIYCNQDCQNMSPDWHSHLKVKKRKTAA